MRVLGYTNHYKEFIMNNSNSFFNPFYKLITVRGEKDDGLYGTKLNKIADEMEDHPMHTLAYYEELVEDPMKDLSRADLEDIKVWMYKSENILLTSDEPSLSKRDLRDIKRWMDNSEDLSVDSEPDQNIFGAISERWDDFCGARYIKGLNNSLSKNISLGSSNIQDA
jgi:hypothetical protein